MRDLIAEKAPKIYRILLEFQGEILRPSKLEKKEKELIAIALSVAVKCEPCIKRHVSSALRAGATEEEIAETIAVAIMMLGLPAYSWSRRVLSEFMKAG